MGNKQEETRKKILEVSEMLKQFVSKERKRLEEGQAISEENQQRLWDCKRKLEQVIYQTSSDVEYTAYK